MRFVLGCAIVMAAAVAASPGAADAIRPAEASLASELALALPAPEPMALRFEKKKDDGGGAKASRDENTMSLSAERAQILLQSLTVPGWGQYTAGHKTSAAVFGLAELGIWVSYAAFRVQTQLRTDAFMRTAQVQAGIDLKGRDEEFKRIVGAYISSDEYNQLVVARDAANLYYDDPAAFQQYFDEHSLKGANVWAWPNDGALLRYQGQRKDSQRAALRANTALGCAVVNRLLSAITAARLGPPTSSPRTWEMRSEPVDGDPTAIRVGVLRHF